MENIKSLNPENIQQVTSSRKNLKMPTKWQRTKDYMSAFCSGFCEYYAEKYEDTNGIFDAIKKTANISNEGFSIMDEYNPINIVKNPIKNLSHSIDEKLDDNGVLRECWESAKGVGDVVDGLTTAKGLTATCLIVGTGGTLAAAFPTAAATAAPILNTTGTIVGSGMITYGAKEIIVDGDTREGTAKIFSGGLMVAASAITAKSSLETANSVGIATKNPATLNTPQAMIENIKVAPNCAKALITPKTNLPSAGILVSEAANFEHTPDVSKNSQVPMHHDINGKNTDIRNYIKKEGSCRGAEYIKENIQEIDAAFEKLPPLKENCTVYRGRGENGLIQRWNTDFEVIDKANIGDVIVPDTGYSYTAFNKSLANQWNSSQYSANGPTRKMMQTIKIPKGAKVSRNLEHGGEVIMPRGAQYKLLEKIYNPETKQINVTLEYILPKE